VRLSVCLLVVLCALGYAAAQPQETGARSPDRAQSSRLLGKSRPFAALSGLRPSLVVGAGPGAQEPPDVFRPTQRQAAELYLCVDFAGARDGQVRAAAPPALAGVAAGRLFESEGAEWQRHYQLGAMTSSLAYAIDDHAGADRCWRSFAAGVLVGTAKELSDSYFDRRDLQATVCGAAVTALLQGVMPRWEW